MIAVKRHSYEQVGEETRQHLGLFCTGVQQVVVKGCDQLEATKAILKSEPPNHIMFVHISLESFRMILMIVILVEMFVERGDQANTYSFQLQNRPLSTSACRCVMAALCDRQQSYNLGYLSIFPAWRE